MSPYWQIQLIDDALTDLSGFWFKYFSYIFAADDEFQTLCFAFGLELDEVVCKYVLSALA